MHIDFDTHTHCTKSVLFFLNYNYYFDSYYVDHKVDTEKGGRKNRNSLVFCRQVAVDVVQGISLYFMFFW